MMSVRNSITSWLILSMIPTVLADIYVFNDANKLVEDYDDQPAGFGPSFPTGGVKGYVVLTHPRNACTKVAPPPQIPTGRFPWIALIPRTKTNETCDFDLKVLHAQEANFSAVIIYNYEDILLTMGPHGRNITIPSTLITLSDGKSLIAEYVYNQTSANATPQFYLKITSEQIFKFGAYIIPFVCIIGVSFIGLCCFMMVKCYLHRRRSRRHRLPRSALKQLKVKKFVKGDRWEVCAICLDDYEEGAKLRILPCDHAYHMKCIDPWLLNNRRQCPVCKRYVFPNQDNSDEEESNGQRATERTPLLQPSEDETITTLSRNRPTDRRIMNPVGAGAFNSVYPINESSETEGEDDEDEDSSSPMRSAINRITTTDLVFDHPPATPMNTPSYPHPQLPRVVIRQSSFEENDNNQTRTTMYESLHDSPATSFTTPRAANFFVGSIGGTTDNTNLSANSVTEDTSDVDIQDTDQSTHSVLSDDVEVNLAYVPDDEESSSVHRTNV